MFDTTSSSSYPVPSRWVFSPSSSRSLFLHCASMYVCTYGMCALYFPGKPMDVLLGRIRSSYSNTIAGRSNCKIAMLSGVKSLRK